MQPLLLWLAGPVKSSFSRTVSFLSVFGATAVRDSVDIRDPGAGPD